MKTEEDVLQFINNELHDIILPLEELHKIGCRSDM